MKMNSNPDLESNRKPPFRKVVFYVSDDLVKEIGNAIAAYGDVLYSVYLGCPISEKYECLTELSDEELRWRFSLLTDFYNKIK